MSANHLHPDEPAQVTGAASPVTQDNDAYVRLVSEMYVPMGMN